MRFLWENSLGLGFGLLFVPLVAQALIGHADFNADQATHHGDPIGLWRYVFSSSYGVDVLENRQSGVPAVHAYIVGTVWLLQKGSPESKSLDQAGASPTATRRSGGRARLAAVRRHHARLLEPHPAELAVRVPRHRLDGRAIFLRQRGSPESKPVGTPHTSTGIEG
jgi:hypothetical protein